MVCRSCRGRLGCVYPVWFYGVGDALLCRACAGMVARGGLGLALVYGRVIAAPAAVGAMGKSWEEWANGK